MSVDYLRVLFIFTRQICVEKYFLVYFFFVACFLCVLNFNIRKMLCQVDKAFKGNLKKLLASWRAREDKQALSRSFRHEVDLQSWLREKYQLGMSILTMFDRKGHQRFSDFFILSLSKSSKVCEVFSRTTHNMMWWMMRRVTHIIHQKRSKNASERNAFSCLRIPLRQETGIKRRTSMRKF